VEKKAGGIPAVVLAKFLQGVAQLSCFPSLNTYCLDVMPGDGAEVISGNYLMRYLFACGGMAIVLPAIQAIGVGWMSTISAAFTVVSTGLLLWTIWSGEDWRKKIDRRKKEAKKRALERTIEDGQVAASDGNDGHMNAPASEK
jgi:hypothetical protein